MINTDMDLKSALGKKRKDGKSAPPLPLTTIQRVHINRLVEKYGDNYEQEQLIHPGHGANVNLT
ncbi:hypothetical protein ACB092_01G204400 [Castanea dentata]